MPSLPVWLPLPRPSPATSIWWSQIRARTITTTEAVYLIADAGAHATAPLAAWTLGHGEIENCLHWVRNLAFDRNRSQVRTRNGPRVMTSVREIAIGLLRTAEHDNIAAVRQHHAHNPTRPADLILSSRLCRVPRVLPPTMTAPASAIARRSPASGLAISGTRKESGDTTVESRSAIRTDTRCTWIALPSESMKKPSPMFLETCSSIERSAKIVSTLLDIVADATSEGRRTSLGGCAVSTRLGKGEQLSGDVSPVLLRGNFLVHATVTL